MISLVRRRSLLLVMREKHTPALGRKKQPPSSNKNNIKNKHFNKKNNNLSRKNFKEEEEDIAVNWYPGHIAKAEKELVGVLKKVDVVVEVRDARIPASTTHPSVSSWVGPHKKVIVVVLRADQTSPRCLADWKEYYRQNPPYAISAPGDSSGTVSRDNHGSRKMVYFLDGKRGKGNMMGLRKHILSCGKEVNDKRRAKGILPRPVRAAVIGFPNVGKSTLINRILGRKLARAQNVAGYTRKLQWIGLSGKVDSTTEKKSHMTIELLDSPGIIPATRLNNHGAMQLAICNDIGAAAYDHTQAAASLYNQLEAISKQRRGYVNMKMIKKRYSVSNVYVNGEDFLTDLAAKSYDDVVNSAADALLNDFRKGKLGRIGLEIPPMTLDSDNVAEQENDESDVDNNPHHSSVIDDDALDFGDDDLADKVDVIDENDDDDVDHDGDATKRGPYDGW